MCTQPIHVCPCEPCDLTRRLMIQEKARELSARFLAREESEWEALKEKSLSRPMARVVDIATRRVRKVVLE